MWCPPKLEQQIWCLLNDEVHSNFRLCNDAGESIPNGSKSYNRVDSMNRPLTHWWKPSVPSSTPNPRTITQGGSQRTSANTSKRPIDFIRLASRINWCGLTSDRLSLRLEIPPLGLPWFREWYHFLPNPNTRTALLGESIVEKKRLWNSWHMVYNLHLPHPLCFLFCFLNKKDLTNALFKIKRCLTTYGWKSFSLQHQMYVFLMDHDKSHLARHWLAIISTQSNATVKLLWFIAKVLMTAGCRKSFRLISSICKGYKHS